MALIRKFLIQTLALVLMAAVAGAIVYRFHPERPELYLTREAAVPGEITVEEALAREKAGPVIWIDARRAQEFGQEHIPGGLLLNQYDWENLLLEAFPVIAEAPEGVPLILYCDGQECEASRKVRELLQLTPIGDREMLILRGGWPAWKAAVSAGR